MQLVYSATPADWGLHDIKIFTTNEKKKLGTLLWYSESTAKIREWDLRLEMCHAYNEESKKEKQ